MEQLVSRFKKVFIDEKSRHSLVAKRVTEIFPPDKVEYVNQMPMGETVGDLSAEEFTRSKYYLYLTEFKGSFFKRCPGAKPGLTCCNYFVLNLGLQCDMNCSYCYLQSFINSPVLTIYTNIDKALSELREIGTTHGDQFLRVGTGEVIDSLSLDELTLYSRQLIEFFKEYPNWRMEFKTKSDKIEQFIDCEHANNIIVSWSVNPQNIIASEEHNTASLEERLIAAQKCAEKGFILSFHIDPMIWHPEWKQSYTTLIEEITSRFSPEQVPYISVGALRFQPEQRHMMRERFGLESLVVQAEVFPGKDGKLRYDQRLRNEMFDFMISGFKSRSPAWNIFLCMETPETWLSSMPSLPKSDLGLKPLFDHSSTRGLS